MRDDTVGPGCDEAGRTGTVETATQLRKRVVAAAELVGADQDGVVSRAQLRGLGVTKSHLRTEVRAKRWRRHGRNSVAVHTGELTERACWRSALFEIGADAALDGVTALIAGGLKGFEAELIHASVSRGRGYREPTGVCVHETRRRRSTDVVGAGIARVRPPVATVRAALWAASDRQAALVIVMAVQQRITTAAAVQQEMSTVRRHRRRLLLCRVIADVVDGAQALGELDFARLCRQRGLPKPSRQVLRNGPRGRVYLDVYWEDLGVVVEIEGVHHGTAGTQVDDALRQNRLTIDADAVLRIPLLGLRLVPEQVAQALARGRRRVA